MREKFDLIAFVQNYPVSAVWVIAMVVLEAITLLVQVIR